MTVAGNPPRHLDFVSVFLFVYYSRFMLNSFVEFPILIFNVTIPPTGSNAVRDLGSRHQS